MCVDTQITFTYIYIHLHVDLYVHAHILKILAHIHMFVLMDLHTELSLGSYSLGVV